MKRMCSVVVLLVGLMLATAASTPIAAQAATTPPATTKGSCAVVHVTLHGTKPAQATCLQATTPTPKGASPATWQEQVNCWGDLILYQNANDGGSQICFAGVGSINLTAYPLGCLPFAWWCWSTWNSQVSSFTSGLTYGHFAWNVNDGGPHYPFSSNDNVNWIGHAWNDQISSVTIDGPN